MVTLSAEQLSADINYVVDFVQHNEPVEESAVLKTLLLEVCQHACLTVAAIIVEDIACCLALHFFSAAVSGSAGPRLWMWTLCLVRL